MRRWFKIDMKIRYINSSIYLIVALLASPSYAESKNYKTPEHNKYSVLYSRSVITIENNFIFGEPNKINTAFRDGIRRNACEAFAFDGKIFEIDLVSGSESNRFAIPKEYAAPLGYGDGETRSAIALRVFTETFNPTRDHAIRSSEATSNILISLVDRDRIKYYLHKLKTNKRPGASTSKDAINGLEYYENAFGGNTYFSESNKGTTEDVIKCTSRYLSKLEICSHTYLQDNYSITVTYPSTYIPKWRSLKEKSSKLMDCFNGLARGN